jgi:hypothetical protein
VELDVPVKPETIFQSGSVGQQFVSAAIMMVVEEGKVSLDDTRDGATVGNFSIQGYDWSLGRLTWLLPRELMNADSWARL